MPKKLTQEEADELDRRVGAIPIGKYVDTKTKREYKCPKCENIFWRCSNDVRNQKQIVCWACSRTSSSTKRTLTQQMADELDRQVGAIPIGLYKGTNTKREYMCNDCNNSYYTTSKIVRHDKQIYCPKCSIIRQAYKRRNNIDYVKQICINQGFEPLFDVYIGGNELIELKCKCGNCFSTTFHQIKTNNGFSCGHCNDPILNKKYNKLTPIIIFPNKAGGGYQVVCQCECGNCTKILEGSKVINGNNKSCGYCKSPTIGDRFGKLIVTEIQYNQSGGGGCRIKCKCDCGRETKWYPSSIIMNGCTSSCGYIISHGERAIEKYLIKNNIKYIQQKRFENCKNKRELPFDFYLPDYNLCIEFNGEQHYLPRAFNSESNNSTYAKNKLKNIQKRDKIKKQYCKLYNIQLLTIKYTQFNKIDKILTKHIKIKI